MRVGVIAAEMERDATGVGRYLSGILEGIGKLSTGWEWRVFFQGDPFDHQLWESKEFLPVFSGRRGSQVQWEQLHLPIELFRHQLDLVFSPAYSLPPSFGMTSVVTMHDLSFELLPEEFGWRERWRRRLLARRACAEADRVLVDCDAMADQVSSLYRVGRGRIGVVPVAIDPRFNPGQGDGDDTVRKKLANLGVRRPYLLSVGTILERRRVDLLVDVLHDLAGQDGEIQLVLAGSNRMRDPGLIERRARSLGVEERVVSLGWVPEDLLPGLYRSAELTFFLSSYEGFGLPPMESLACGTAAVVGPGVALTELWPGYPLLCRELGVTEVAATTRRALGDSVLRDEVVSQAREPLRHLTRERVAERLVTELARARQAREGL